MVRIQTDLWFAEDDDSVEVVMSMQTDLWFAR